MVDYQTVLTQYLNNPVNNLIFKTEICFFTLKQTHEQLLNFKDKCKLVSLPNNTFLYASDYSSIDPFIPIEDATHIYYESSVVDPYTLTIPLMLKIDEDSFSIYLVDGWQNFPFKFNDLGIDQSFLYHL